MDGKTLAGKVVLVTGSSRGIGRALALRLARDGAAVVVNDAGADAAAFLASDDARWVNGRNLRADGGVI